MISVQKVQSIYNFMRKVCHYFGYNIDIRKVNVDGFPEHVPEDFIKKLSKLRDLTLVPWEGLFMSYQAAIYVAQQGIEGDIVECGVWQGGVSIMMAEAANAIDRLANRKRKFYFYDTFEGFPEPGPNDINQIFQPQKGPSKWCHAPLEEVQKNVAKSNVPFDQFVFIKGKVEDTIPGKIPDKIALLRLDTDFYESTAHELLHLYPRLVPGGILICDDYSTWEGARKASDEHFAAEKKQPLLYIDPHCGRVMAIKP